MKTKRLATPYNVLTSRPVRSLAPMTVNHVPDQFSYGATDNCTMGLGGIRSESDIFPR
jgi:hypothetical protein